MTQETISQKPPKTFATPFADSGDKNAIPDTGVDAVNIQQGFPSIFSTPRANSGKSVARRDMNGILNSLSSLNYYFQYMGRNPWVSGTSYPKGAKVWYDNAEWISPFDNNTTAPGGQNEDGEDAWIAINDLGGTVGGSGSGDSNDIKDILSQLMEKVNAMSTAGWDYNYGTSQVNGRTTVEVIWYDNTSTTTTSRSVATMRYPGWPMSASNTTTEVAAHVIFPTGETRSLPGNSATGRYDRDRYVPAGSICYNLPGNPIYDITDFMDSTPYRTGTSELKYGTSKASAISGWIVNDTECDLYCRVTLPLSGTATSNNGSSYPPVDGYLPLYAYSVTDTTSSTISPTYSKLDGPAKNYCICGQSTGFLLSPGYSYIIYCSTNYAGIPITYTLTKVFRPNISVNVLTKFESTNPGTYTKTIEPGTYNFVIVGGGGGAQYYSPNYTSGSYGCASGGSGGCITGNFTVTDEQTISIVVGATADNNPEWNANYLKASDGGASSITFEAMGSRIVANGGAGGVQSSRIPLAVVVGAGGTCDVENSNDSSVSITVSSNNNGGSGTNGWNKTIVTIPTEQPANSEYPYGLGNSSGRPTVHGYVYIEKARGGGCN